MIKPLNNNCLIEVIDEYDGIIRDSANENVQKGILKEVGLISEHLTASTGHSINDDTYIALIERMNEYIGKSVYWQEYADAGSKFKIDGKNFVLVPFYRLIGFEE